MIKMDNNFYIYFHINPIKNEIFYVGKGRDGRAYDTNRNKFWNNVVNKYGDPKIVIVKDNISEKYAFLLEKAYIKILGRKDLRLGPLVNLTNGGDGISGYKHTDDAIQKISKSNIGNNYILGKIHSNESKMKTSTVFKGRKHSKEICKKISDGHKSKQLSDNNKNKISDTLKGNILWNTSKKRSEETKRKISETLKNKNKKI